MNKIDELGNRIVKIKSINHELNRHKEDVPPLFWIGVVLMALLVMSNWLG